jgi:cell division protein FtsN
VLLPLLARILRLASIAICLIALAWFLVFALDESGKASGHQQAEVRAAESSSTQTAAGPPAGPRQQSSLRKDLDKAFSTVASPFSGLTSGSKSQWTIHIVNTLLVLLVYGFGLGFVARLVRIGV